MVWFKEQSVSHAYFSLATPDKRSYAVCRDNTGDKAENKAANEISRTTYLKKCKCCTEICGMLMKLLDFSSEQLNQGKKGIFSASSKDMKDMA